MQQPKEPFHDASSDVPGISSVSAPLRVVFMGTPEFAVPCLQALLDSGEQVVAVVAQPDRPAGRGNKLHSPPTIQLARRLGIPTVQAEKVRVPAFRETLESFAPDVMVVVAYGRILTEAVLAVPRWGCINVHASLLPSLRGAAPIQRAVLTGLSHTGVTTMKMDVGLDTGDMLLSRVYPIGHDMTAGALHDVLAPLGASLLVETLAALKAGTLTAHPQEDALATWAPPLKKEEGLLDWSRSSQQVDFHVRGMSPWPGAYSFLHGRRMGIVQGRPLEDVSSAFPGTILGPFQGGLRVATGRGCYVIDQVKPENGRSMPVLAWLNGHPIPHGVGFTHGMEES